MIVKGEDALQIACADYIKLQYPDKLFTHIANERKAHVAYHQKLKRMGLRRGMSDVMIFDPSSDGRYVGFACELKFGKNKPTKEQREVLLHLHKSGWFVCVRKSFDKFRETLDLYFQ